MLSLYILQGSRSPDFGAEIRPHSQCQKVCFFPNSRQKIPNLKKKKKKFFFFFLFSIFISNNTNTEHIVLHYISRNKSKFSFWNQSSNGNAIHKDDVKFPNFSQNAMNFPNSMGPGPIPKKGCESPVLLLKAHLIFLLNVL